MIKSEKIKLISELAVKIWKVRYEEAEEGAVVGSIWLDSISDAQELLRTVEQNLSDE